MSGLLWVDLFTNLSHNFVLSENLEDGKVGGAKWSTPLMIGGLTIKPLPFFRINNCKYKPEEMQAPISK